ncbi:Y-family DNA polymerase [Inmirania thermothiophila]|uniref:Protein ImuB n=1 Tax=Inmirania thermothiophila TaxID=1750597 RepID=A0A3N1Y0K0_9GAMM|nr:DNA polymerase Y family protein [Inmirania thermothiophila]ROR32363.1 protein ImuB [Inmirania thermothiophila]
MLWLSLHLPRLALEVAARGAGEEGPLVVVEGEGGRGRVLARNRAAARTGIRPGMSLAAAWALAPGLLVRPRDPRAEADARRRLAAWCLQFTPRVSLETEAAMVLLEIGGCLRIWGGLEGLLGRVRGGAAALGYRVRIGVAPTPAAAEALARLGTEPPVLHRRLLPARLAPLPLGCLGLPEGAVAALRGLGVRDLRGCLRLPRDGLARRIGPAAVHHLDRLLGRAPDPRAPYEPPPAYHGEIELPAETADVEALRFALRRLLGELCGLLRGRALGVREIGLALCHREGEPTRLRVGLATPGRDPAHLEGVVRAHLHRLRLDRPVCALALGCTALEPLPERSGDLLAPPRRGDAGWPVLLDRLTARLGPGAVQVLGPAADHRPERAWRLLPPEAGPSEDDGEEARPRAPRPLWLLPRPAALPAGADRLPRGWRLRRGPERIESGWWDGGDIARDYYLAENGAGSRGWVFRDRRSGRWYLHGLFA